MGPHRDTTAENNQRINVDLQNPFDDYNTIYIGQSKRRIKERVFEHVKSVKRGDRDLAI